MVMATFIERNAVRAKYSSVNYILKGEWKSPRAQKWGETRGLDRVKMLPITSVGGV
jgi:hypothetical protein